MGDEPNEPPAVAEETAIAAAVTSGAAAEVSGRAMAIAEEALELARRIDTRIADLERLFDEALTRIVILEGEPEEEPKEPEEPQESPVAEAAAAVEEAADATVTVPTPIKKRFKRL